MKKGKTKLKIGIVGLGIFFNKRHRPALQKLSGKYDIQAVHSSSEQKFLAFRKDCLHAEYAPTLSALLSAGIDAVVMIVPIPLHFEIGKKVLEAGKHLIMEKPMTAGARQAKALCQIAAKKRKKIYVTENFRFLKALQTCRDLLRKKTLGNVRMVRASLLHCMDKSNPYLQNGKGWRVNPSGYDGILLDGGIHMVSLLRMMFGKIDLKYRSLSSWNKTLGKHDTAVLHLKADGADTVLTISYSVQEPDRELMRIYCEKGLIALTGNTLRVDRPGQASRQVQFDDDEFVTIYSDIYDDLTGRKSISFTARDAYQDMVVFEKLFKGKPVAR